MKKVGRNNRTESTRFPDYSMFVEYKCTSADCNFSRLEVEIIIKYKCPKCGRLCIVYEEVDS
jgi:predicted RNA-binding Zn-ribbon protein involved in translation (DUF1610 family)